MRATRGSRLDMLLDEATNLLGPLDEEVRRRVLAAIRRPSPESWDNAYSIIVNGTRLTTLWQAVLAVDPTFPRSVDCPDDPPAQRWERTPDSFTLVRALRAAVR